MKLKKTDKQNTQPLIEEMEPRILFSAGLEGIFFDSLSTDNESLALYQNKDENTLQPASAVSTRSVVSARQELVFVDTNTPDYQTLIDDLLANNDEDRTIQWVLLDSDQDGIQQISDVLANYQNLDAVHIISHGSDGSVQLGNSQLNLDSIISNAAGISNWSDAFSETGDILIYGCNLAGSETGQSLINSLSKLTLTDVAASDDLTGHAQLGGDWDLEFTAGTVETTIAFSDETQQTWNSVLADTIYESYEIVNDQLEITNTQAWIQRFVHTSGSGTYDVNTISLWLKQDAATSQTLTVSLLNAWNGFLIPGTTTTIDSSALNSNFTQHDLNLASTVTLSDSIPYYIRVESDSSAGKVYVGYDPTGTYIDGELYHSTFGATGLDLNDMAFRISLNAGGNSSPVITSDGGGVIANINVIENTTAVTTVTASDADLDTLTYSIDSASNDASFFSIDTNSGALTFNTAPDFETPADFDGNNAYEVTVRANDGNGGVGSQTINVTVTNEIELIVTNSNATGTGSLHQAILEANANTGVTDTISFNISTGPQTILVDAGGLPTITDSLILDATTQPGYSGTPLITLDGSLTPASSGINGIVIRADDSTVKGFIVINFADEGIEIDGSTGFGDNNIIQNNWVGIDRFGNVAGNSEYGVMISVDATGNLIGGSGPNEGNVISGNGTSGAFSGIIIENNSDNNTVEGNIIGLKADGTVAGNSEHGIFIESGSNNNIIGGISSGSRNIISGNLENGVFISDVGTDNNQVLGNYIGTNLTGDDTTGTGNGESGVQIDNGASFNQIGGGNLGEGNVISGNSDDGVHISDFTSQGTTGNTVYGNLIGTDRTGTISLGNTLSGIVIANGASLNTIGGSSTKANVIGGNVDGIIITGATTTGNKIQGNYIGTDTSATIDLGNSDEGIDIQSGANNNLIGGTFAGEGNVIAYNASDGIDMGSDSGTNNAILGNLIFGHGSSLTSIGIDLGATGVTANDPGDSDPVTPNTANNLQNFPVLTTAISDGSISITINGTLNTDGLNQDYRIEFFASTVTHISGNGEAERYLGAATITTNGSGNAAFNVVLGATVGAGEFITATATVDLGAGSYGDTSEFSSNITSTVPNVAPVLTTTPGGGTFIEDSSHSFVDITTTVTDVDSVNFGTGILTASLTNNGTANDRLSLLHEGTGAGQVEVAGNTILIDSVLMATFSGGVGVGDPLLITFTDQADANDVTVIAQHIVFSNASDDPSGLQRQISLQITDGDSGTSTTEIRVMNVTPVNDAPTTGNASSGTLEDPVFAQINLNGADVDGTVTHFKLNNLPANGILYLDSALTITVSANVDYPRSGLLLPMYFVPDTNWSGTTTFDYLAKDDQGAYSATAGTATITITPVNDAPVSSNSAAYTAPDSAYTFSIADFNFSDVDTADTLQLIRITGITGSGALTVSGSGVSNNDVISVADITAGNLKFTPVPGENGTNYASFNFEVHDGTVYAATSSSMTINVSGLTPSYFQRVQGGGIAVDSAGMRLDSAFSGGTHNPTLTVSGIPAGATVVDAFLYINELDFGAIDLNFTLNGNNVVMTEIGSSADPNWGANRAVTVKADVSSIVTSNGSYILGGVDPIDAYEGAILVVVYEDLSVTSDSLITLHDGSLTLRDFDNINLPLSFNNGSALPVAHTSASTTIITFDGQDFFSENGVSFQATTAGSATSIIPANSFGSDNGGSEQFTVDITTLISQADTGATLSQQSTTSNDFLVYPFIGTVIELQNSAPIANNVSASGNEDAASIAITLTGTDSDGSVDNFQLNGLPANGTLYLDAGLSTVAATATDYAATAGSLTLYFKPNFNWNGNTTFDFVAKDNNGLLSASAATATVTVNPVNDAPVIASGAYTLPTITEDDVNNTGQTVQQVIDSAGGSGISDVDSDPDGIAIISNNENTGTWQYSTNGGSNWLDVGTVSGTSALLLRNTDLVRFQPNSIEGSPANFGFRAWDQTTGTAGTKVDASTVGGVTAFSLLTESAQIAVSDVNDAPVTSGISNDVVNEDAPDSVIDLFATFADVEDLDPALTYTVVGNTNAALFTSTLVNGVAGTLTLDYASDQYGTADITVRATDTGTLFVETTFTVTVNAINDAPTITALAQFADGGQNLGGSNSLSISIGDVDGDGDLDMVVANYALQANQVYLNDGSGNYTDSGQALGNSNSDAIVLGDIDGDGDLDIVVANFSNLSNKVYTNDGNGTFTDSGQTLGSSDSSTVTLGDIDGDGDLDMIVGNFNNQSDKVYINNGAGNFTDSGQNLGNLSTRSIALGDVDGDGDLDIVAGNQNSGNTVFINNGSGVFTDSGQALGISITYAIALGDIDGDGDLDLVEANLAGQANRIFTNNGSGIFTDSGQLLGSGESSSLALGDIDGDGDLDLIIGNFSDEANKVYSNDGSGTFTDSGQLLGTSSTRAINLADVDSDGNLDVIASNDLGQANKVYFNNSATSNFAPIALTEGDPAQTITSVGIVGDIDSIDFSTGNLTIDYSVAGDAGDQLSVNDQGAGAGQIGFDGSNVSYEGINIGSLNITNNGLNGNALTINLNSSATPVAVTALLRNITFQNTSNMPAASRTLSIQVNDGDGGSSVPVNQNISITAQNDDPFNTGSLPPFFTGSEDISFNINLSSIDISDADAGSNALTLTLTTSTGGNLTALAGTGITIGGGGTSVVTLTGNLTDLNNYLDIVGNVTYLHSITHTNGSPSDTLKIDITDNGNSGAGGGGTITLGTRNINILSVNDAPVTDNVSASGNEDDTSIAITLTGSDVDGSVDRFRIGTLPANGILYIDAGLTTVVSLGSENNATGEALTLYFVPDTNWSGITSFQFAARDNGGILDTSPATATITVTLLNDAPTVNATASDSGTEDTDLVYTHAQLLTLVGAADADDLDSVLTINITNINNGSLVMTGGTGGLGTNFTFTPTPNSITNLTFDYQVSDDNSPIPASSTIGTATVTINAINDAPVVITTSTPLNYSEQATSIIDPALTVTDTDSSQIVGATISITSGHVPGEDTLNFLNQLGITGNYNSTTGVLSLSGTTTIINYETAIRAITYRNSSNAPDTTTRTISFIVDDGTDTSLPVTRDIIINPRNDAPLITAPLIETTPQDIGLIFSSTNGNAISITDPDLGNVEITLTVTNGTLSLNGITNLTFTSGSGSADATMTFSGSLFDINNSLDGMIFDPASGFNGSDNLQIIVNDQGNTGSGVPLVDSTSVFITVGETIPVATDDPGDFSSDISALNPVSNWRLGEPSGTTIVDNGSAGANGTVNGATLGQPGALNGDSNTAAHFDGVDDYIEITHSSDFLLDDGTIQFWFNADTIGIQQALLSKDHTNFGTGGHVTIWLTSSGTIQTRLQSTSVEYYVESNNPVTAGQWHHIAFSFGSNGMELFLDGVLADVNGYTGGLATTSGGAGNSESIVLGTTNYQGSQGVLDNLVNFFQGSIDEVSIVSNQLDAEQIQNIFSAGLQNYTIAENTSLNVATTEGVLINDTDIDGDSLTAVLVSGPSFASTFTLNADGSFDYTPIAGFDGTDTFTYRANDGVNASNLATVTITVTGNNDAPVLNLTPGGGTFYESSTGNVFVDVSGLLSDTDSSNFDGGQLTVTLSANGTVNDRLSVFHEGTGAGQIGVLGNTVSYGGLDIGSFTGGDSASNPLIFSFNTNATPVAVEALIQRIVFSNVSDAPSELQRQIQVVVTDGDGGTSNTGTRSVNVIAVNDAPIHSIPGTQTALEETSTSIAGISINDIDETGGNFTVHLQVISGNINVTLSGSTIVFAGTNNSNDMTLDGTLADINTTLASLRYTGATNITGTNADTLTITTDDGGDYGVGGPQQDIDTIQIDITAVNDGPVTNNVSVSGNEDATSITITLSGSDIDGTVNFFQLNSIPANGTLYTDASLSVLAATGTDYAATAEALTLYYTPSLNFNGVTSFQFTAKDNSGLLSTTPATAAITVNAVNDSPTISAPATDATTADTTLTLSSSNGNAISISDIDDANAMVEVTLSTSNGDLTLSTIAGLSFSIGDGNNDAAMTFTGSVTAINAALDGLQLQPVTTFQGTAIVTIDVNDLGNSGNGTPLSTSSNISVLVDTSIPPPSEPSDPETPSEPEIESTPPTSTNEPDPEDGSAIADPELVLEPNIDTRGQQRPAPPTHQPVNPERTIYQYFEDIAENITEIPADVLEKVINRIDIPKTMLPLQSNIVFWNAIDSMLDELDDSFADTESKELFIANAIRGTTWTLSAGFVAWILRGGSLIAAAMSSIPIWKGLDPLPVIAMSRKEHEKREENKRVDQQEEDELQQEIGELIDGARLEDPSDSQANHR